MPAMARHQDRRKLLMLALVLQLVGFCGFIWLPLQFAGLVGDGVWVRSGRRVSALFAAGARSLCAISYCWQAGGVYAGNRFYHRRACPVVFWRAA